MNIPFISRYFKGRTVAIMGFGREGKSTYRLLRSCLPDLSVIICDQSSDVSNLLHEATKDADTHCFFGEHYLDGLTGADIIVRSPGIPFRELESYAGNAQITSQTEVFLSVFRKQVIGITGTKGKSTTASLLYHMFQYAGKNAVLVGNIGIPPFDLLSDLDENTVVIMELSSHQLERIRVSPHIAVLLNIFEEHLDHYPSFLAYQQAKLNIARWQQADDYLIVNQGNPYLKEQLKGLDTNAIRILLSCASDGSYAACFDKDNLVLRLPGLLLKWPSLAMRRMIPGEHNLMNIAAAVAAALLSGLDEKFITGGVESFPGLPHRLEHAGIINQRTFINDSISTIPESTMAALQTFPETATVILGGYDRGIQYDKLLSFLASSALRVLIFTGPAGRRMYDMAVKHRAIKKKVCLLAADFSDAVSLAASNTREGEVCLLSPAAASYDAFKDFTERGEVFKKLIKAWELA